jgi:hypothetical protein
VSDHIQLAREYIAKGDEFYAKAAGEIVAAKEERPELTWAEIGRQLGRDESWVRKLATSFRNPARRDDEPFSVDWQSGANTQDVAAARVLKNPEQRKQAITSLTSDQIEEVIAEAQDVAVERVRAQRSEHNAEAKAPTAGDLMDGERWDPSESWADTLLIRCNRNLRELGKHVEKWGFVLGSMKIEDALDYVNETERLAAEVRVVVQAQLRDRAEV